MEPREEMRSEPVVVPPSGPGWARRNAFQLIAWTIVLALLLVFVWQNDETVEVRMIAWDVDLRLAWALLIASGLGLVLGWLLSRLRR
jgi:uncharacterized integral membrane protein